MTKLLLDACRSYTGYTALATQAALNNSPMRRRQHELMASGQMRVILTFGLGRKPTDEEVSAAMGLNIYRGG